MPPSVYGGNGQVNGFTGEYGTPVNVRPPPTEVDVDTLIKAQKFTKFALSALMFEDLETARNELKKALQLLS
jgi:Vta1 C-terminal domain